MKYEFIQNCIRRKNELFRHINYLKIKPFLRKAGTHVIIDKRFYCWGKSNVEIGSYTYINHDVEIDAQYNRVVIGKYVIIGSYVYIGTVNHGFTSYSLPIQKQNIISGKVEIGDDVWIGTKAVILPGIIVGRGAIIGAGAVVTKNVPAFAIVGGVPAKVLRFRFENETMKKALHTGFNKE